MLSDRKYVYSTYILADAFTPIEFGEIHVLLIA